MGLQDLETYQKIIQLFDSDDETNVALACELIKGCGMPPVIVQKLKSNLEGGLYFFANYGLVQHFAQSKALDLSRLGLAVLPPAFATLSQLEHLNLAFNQLVELPETLEQLNQLKVLLLHYNKLATLPISLGAFRQLEELTLCFNRLTNLPASIAQLNSLRVLHLHHNQLSQLPLELNSLPRLEKITLWGNAFSLENQALLSEVFDRVALVF
ncbi:leucine-rich repeat domain-containing protein [uncultured Microscilla sp.]|uniref:leucine-rich repeat domain-containing protein n=1 Tax=uncultured Microscilla sp. TaxID=432653 RepID=UPI002611EF64|nr:leucine-rich repeat domain-containing protein [uncultured Microscilla sp.]